MNFDKLVYQVKNYEFVTVDYVAFLLFIAIVISVVYAKIKGDF